VPIPKREVDRKHAGGSDEVPLALAGVGTNLDVETSGHMAGMDKGTFNERVKDVPSGREGHVPGPAAGQPAQWFWDTQPGIGRDWLPEGLFPEIDELRAEQMECLEGLREAGAKSDAIVAGFEAEDEARNAALYAGDPAPSVTGTAEREDTMREVEAERFAAKRKLHDFYLRAVATFKQMAPAWEAQFAVRRAQHAAEVDAAKAALSAAEREAANVEQAEQWIDRTVNPRGGRYVKAPTFGVGFMTEREAEDKARGKRDDVYAQMQEQDVADGFTRV
jgi:hypothetical protein